MVEGISLAVGTSRRGKFKLGFEGGVGWVLWVGMGGMGQRLVSMG